MASKFFPGMTNVLEVLNQMWTAFAAGPYNALPLTGGALSGPVTSDSTFDAVSFRSGGNVVYSAVRAPNAGVGGVPGTYYEVQSLGVIHAPGYSNGGRFFWETVSNPGAAGAGFVARIRVEDGGVPSARALLSISGGGNLTVAGQVSAANIVPNADNTRTVGTAALAYATLYARTGTINTSDARLKCDFRDLTPAEIAAARDIARAIGIYRWRDAVDCKGQLAREHIGPTVQRAIEIMEAHGLDPFGYGFICHDEWEQQTIEHPAVEAVPADGEHPATEARAAYTEVTLEAGDRYAFRYDELAMFIAAGQEVATAAIEARLAALEVR